MYEEALRERTLEEVVDLSGDRLRNECLSTIKLTI